MTNLKGWLFLWILVLAACGRLSDIFSSSHDTPGAGQTLPETEELQILDPVLHQRAMSLLETRCSGCHGKKSIGAGAFNYVNEFEQLISRGMVVPGDHNHSQLYRRVVDRSMPPGGGMKSVEIETLMDWISVAIRQ